MKAVSIFLQAFHFYVICSEIRQFHCKVTNPDTKRTTKDADFVCENLYASAFMRDTSIIDL